MTSVLKLLIDVDQKGAVGKLNGLAGGFAKGAIAVGKFALPVAGAIGGLTALAAEAEKSDVRLETAFKNMGKQSGKTLAQLQDQADALGEATTFDDEGIKDAQATLLSFGVVSGKAFDQTLVAATDLAAATGKDLPTATTLLGKALADPTAAAGKLSKAGIVLTKQQEKQIAAFEKAGETGKAQAVILEALEERYKGTNEALSNSAAGETAQALEDLTNAGEEIGAIFLPILAGLAKGVQGFAHFIQDNFPTIQAVVSTVMEGIGTAFGFVTELFSSFGGSGGAGSLFAGAFKIIGEVVDFFAKNVLPFLLQAFNQVVAFLKENGPTIGSILTQAFGAIKSVLEVVVPILIRVAEVVFPAILTAAGILLKGLDGTFKLIGGIFEVAGTVVETMVDVITGAWKTLSKATETIWNGITGIIKGVLNGVIDAMNSVFGFMNGLSFGIGPFDLGPVHIGAATFDPFNLPTIPRLAAGGIIDSPTLALIGESGPEAVVPLSKSNSLGDGCTITLT